SYRSDVRCHRFCIVRIAMHRRRFRPRWKDPSASVDTPDAPPKRDDDLLQDPSSKPEARDVERNGLASAPRRSQGLYVPSRAFDSGPNVRWGKHSRGDGLSQRTGLMARSRFVLARKRAESDELARGHG